MNVVYPRKFAFQKAQSSTSVQAVFKLNVGFPEVQHKVIVLAKVDAEMNKLTQCMKICPAFVSHIYASCSGHCSVKVRLVSNHVPLPSRKVMKSVKSTYYHNMRTKCQYLHSNGTVKGLQELRCLQTARQTKLSEVQPALLSGLLMTIHKNSRQYALSTSLIRVTKGYHCSICNT